VQNVIDATVETGPQIVRELQGTVRDVQVEIRESDGRFDFENQVTSSLD